MIFQEGHYLIGLVVAALALLIGAVHLKRRSACLNAFTRLSPRLNDGGSPWPGVVLFPAALALLSLALAGPERGETGGLHRGNLDLLFVVDTSRSMLAVEGGSSRLDHAKREVRALLERLGGDRVGLIAFAGGAKLACPLTSDLANFERFLHALNPYAVLSGGTSLFAGLKQVPAAFDDEDRVRVAILLSDGEDLGDPKLACAQAAKNLDSGIRHYTVMVGDPSGAKIPDPDGPGFVKDAQMEDVISRPDPAVMRRLASEGGGVFVPAWETAFPLDLLYTQYLSSLETPASMKAKLPTYQGLLLVGLLLLAAKLFYPLRGKGALMLCVPLLLTAWLDAADLVRRGVEQYHAGEYTKALSTFEDALEAGETVAAPAARFGAGLACYRLAESKEEASFARAAGAYFTKSIDDGVWPEDARINLELSNRLLETRESDGTEPGGDGASTGGEAGSSEGAGGETGAEGKGVSRESKEEIFSLLEEMDRKRMELEQAMVRAARSRGRRQGLVIPVVLFLTVLLGPEIEARLEPAESIVGSKVRLIIEVIGEEAADCDVARVPEIPGVQVEGIEGPKISVRPLEKEGTTVLVATFAVVLTPLKPGRIEIPPIQITVQRGDQFLSPALELIVEEGKPSTSTLMVEAEKTKVHLYERCSIRITLRMTEKSLRDGERLTLPWLDAEPSFVDLIIEPLEPEAAQRRVKLARGEMYLPFFIRGHEVQCGLSFLPVKTGTFSFPASTYTVCVPGQEEALVLTSRPFSVEVIPLPEENRPDSFTNGVGSLSAHFEVYPLQVKLGDPLELTVEVRGSGNVAYLEMPEYGVLEKEFRTYGVDGGMGRRTYHIAPRSLEVKEIPKLSFSWFDPHAGRYETVEWGPTAIRVMPGNARVMGTEGPGPKGRIATIIRDWPSRDGTVVLLALSASALFLSSLVLLFAFLNSRRREAERRWKAAEEVRGVLSRFRARARGEDPDALAQAFGEFINERFGIARSEAMTGSLGRMLMDRGVREGLVSKVEHFLHRLDARRFQKESSRLSQDLIDEGVDLAAELDEEALP